MLLSDMAGCAVHGEPAVERLLVDVAFRRGAGQLAVGFEQPDARIWRPEQLRAVVDGEIEHLAFVQVFG